MHTPTWKNRPGVKQKKKQKKKKKRKETEKKSVDSFQTQMVKLTVATLQ